MKKKIINKSVQIIALNKRAYNEYFIKEKLEAGLVLKGWEVKSLRSGNANISDSYILLHKGEAYLFGSIFQPLLISAKHVDCDPKRNRKLLLNQHELDSMYGYINCEGYTVIALSLYWKNAWCKLQIGIVRGKKQYDKRQDIKNREWRINKERIMKKIYL